MIEPPPTDHRDTPVGGSLPPDYFSPGTSTMNGRTISSLWAEIPHQGEWLRFERPEVGAPWTRVEIKHTHE